MKVIYFVGKGLQDVRHQVSATLGEGKGREGKRERAQFPLNVSVWDYGCIRMYHGVGRRREIGGI
jgi:hypothetical protein